MKSDHDSLLAQAEQVFQPSIDEPEFRAAMIVHAVVELFSRLALPDRVFIVFVAILAYARGYTEFRPISQPTLAHTIYDLRKAPEKERRAAYQRIGRYAARIRDGQAFVVIQMEIRREQGANKNEISLYAAHAWDIIHAAIEYLPTWEELPEAYDQCKGMKEAMDRAIDDYHKGHSKLAARLGRKKLPLTAEQRINALMTQCDRIIEAEFINGEPGAARKLQMVVWERTEQREGDMRAWENRNGHHHS